MKYAKDLQSITPHSYASDRTCWELPIRGYVHPTFALHGRRLSQSVDVGENGHSRNRQRLLDFRERYSLLRFPDFLLIFSSHSTRVPTPAPSAHGRHLIIGGEFASVGLFYRQHDLKGQRLFVLDVVAKNVHRQVVLSLAGGFGEVGERIGISLPADLKILQSWQSR